MTGPKPRYVRSEAVLTRHAATDTLLLGLGSDSVVVLRGSGPTIWGLLRRPMSLDALIEALAHRYDVDPRQIQDDVERTVRTLTEDGLLAEVAA